MRIYVKPEINSSGISLCDAAVMIILPPGLLQNQFFVRLYIKLGEDIIKDKDRLVPGPVKIIVGVGRYFRYHYGVHYARQPFSLIILLKQGPFSMLKPGSIIHRLTHIRVPALN